MSVVLDFEICQSANNKQLDFSETTGVYDASDNPEGWGSPNEATSDATDAVLTITDTAGDDHTLDLLALSSFPETDDSVEYIIDMADLGESSDDEFPDGRYIFKYEVTTSTTTYTQVREVLLYGQAQCCVYDLFQDVDPKKLDAIEAEKANKAWTSMMATIAASVRGEDSRFDTLLEQTEDLCSCTSNCCT